MLSAIPSDWREWFTHPAFLTSAVVGVSFFSLALFGKEAELELFCDQRRNSRHPKRCNSLLQFAWNVLVHPDAVDLSHSLFMERYPADLLKERVFPLYSLVGGDPRNRYVNEKRSSVTNLHNQGEQSDVGQEDLEGYACDDHSGGGSEDSDCGEISAAAAECAALQRRATFLEERAVHLQHEVARHRVAAALAEDSMRRERELRVSAEEDARMYKESMEEQYLMQQQLRDAEAKLRQAAAREAALVREIHNLRLLLSEYEDSSEEEPEM